MKKSQQALYAQKSVTAEYGIQKSQYHSSDNEPRWTTTSKTQNLGSQLPKSASNRQKLSISKEYKKKLVHEWNEGDVAAWLKSILTPHFSSKHDITSAANDNNMTNYIWAFNQKKVDGIFLITKIDSEQDIINKLELDSSMGGNIDDEIIKSIYKGITKLKKKAKKQINNLHPMKQSNLDPEVRHKFKKKTLSLGAHKVGTPRDSYINNKDVDEILNESNMCSCLFFFKLTNYRYYRISMMAVMLLIFCVIEAIDFIPDQDWGGTISMFLFLFGTVTILYVLYKERKENIYDENHPNYVKLSHGGQTSNQSVNKEKLLPNYDRRGSDNDVEYDSDYNQRIVKRTWSEHRAADKQFYESKKYTFSVNCGHVIAIICILLGGISFIASRWIELNANTIDEWLYGFGIGIYIGGLCVMLAVDIAFLRLLDDHRRRILCLYFIHFNYYLFVIGFYAVNGAKDDFGLNFVLGLIAIISAILSLIILLIYSNNRCVIRFSRFAGKVILPWFVLSAYIASTIVLIMEYGLKFSPIPEASVTGSVSFIILSSLFTFILTIDSRIFIL